MVNLKKIINKNPWFLNLAKLGCDFLSEPLFLLIHLTLSCNCRCQACYQRYDNFYQNRKSEFIDFEQLEKFLKEARKFFIKPRLHLFGGEPLLHPDFEKILTLMDESGIKSSLTTNGVLLEKFADKISSSGLDQINVSLDDLGEEHDLLRNFRGCFGRVLGGIKALRGKKKSGWQNKTININCLIGENNYFRLTDMVNYFIKNNLNINLLAFQHSYFDPTAQQPQIDLVVLKIQIEAVTKIKAPFEIVFIPKIKNKDLEEFYFLDKKKSFKNSCLMPWLGLSILPNLEVTPGGGVLGCNLVIGDLKKSSLKEIWRSQSLNDFREKIRQKSMPAACSRCCHRRYY